MKSILIIKTSVLQYIDIILILLFFVFCNLILKYNFIESILAIITYILLTTVIKKIYINYRLKISNTKLLYLTSNNSICMIPKNINKYNIKEIRDIFFQDFNNIIKNSDIHEINFFTHYSILKRFISQYSLEKYENKMFTKIKENTSIELSLSLGTAKITYIGIGVNNCERYRYSYSDLAFKRKFFDTFKLFELPLNKFRGFLFRRLMRTTLILNIRAICLTKSPQA